MKLLLKYDCQYGFKELYMTETEQEFDVSEALIVAEHAVLTDPAFIKEDISFKKEYIAQLSVDHLEDIYEEYKIRPLDLFDETSESEFGLLAGDYDMIRDCTLEDAYHDIFKKLVGQFPGYFKMYNCRLELVEDEDSIVKFADGSTATVEDIHNLVKKVLAGEDVETKELAVKEPAVKTVSPKEVDSGTACAMLGISRQTLANWVKAGKVIRTASGKYDYESIKKLEDTSEQTADHNYLLTEFKKLKFNGEALSDKICTSIITYCLTKFNSTKARMILDLYRGATIQDNDIDTWDEKDHEIFMTKYLEDNLDLDLRRYFTEDMKCKILERDDYHCTHHNEDGTCCEIGGYDNLEVEHIVPWSKGGRTTVENGQSVCIIHNNNY